MKQKLLKLYDKNKNILNPIMEYKDFCIESTLSTGDRVLSFQIVSELAKNIELEGYIETEDDEFVIKEISTNGVWKSITCNLNVEGLEGTIFLTFSNEGNLVSCMDKVIEGTGWTYENNSTSTKTRALSKDGCSSWEILQQIRKSYAVEFKFDSKTKKITIYDTRGSDKGVFFLEDLNLKDLSIQGNSYDFYTKIIAYGKDDLTVTVTDNTYSNKVKTLYWKDERYTDETSLTEDATLKLKQYSTPYIAYSTTTKSLNNVELGDTVTLISKKNNIIVNQRVVKLYNYKKEDKEDKCEIANSILTFEDLQREAKEQQEEQTRQIQDSLSDISSGSGITQDDLDTALEDYVKTDDFDTYKDEQAKKDAKSGENLLVNGDFKYFQYCEDGFWTSGQWPSRYGNYRIYGWDTNEISSAVRGREIVRDGGIDGGECILLPGLSGQNIQQAVDLSDTDSEYIYIRGFMKEEEDTELNNNYPFIFDFYAEVGENETALGDTVVWHPSNDRINNTSYYIYPKEYKDGWYKYERTYKIPQGANCMRLLVEGNKRKVYIDKLEVKVTSDGTNYTPSFGDKKLATNTSRKTLMFTSAMWQDDTTNTDWKSITFDNPFSTQNVTCAFTNDIEGCRELVKYEVTENKITCFNDRAFDGHILIINEEGE